MGETQLPVEKTTSNSLRSIDDLIDRVNSYYPNPTEAEVLVRKAYDFSKKAHEGQFRRSGEPYINHPLNVAAIIADIKLDLPTLITGLLHDTVEDTAITLEDLDREFGKEVSQLVDGVTKISRISFKNTHEKQGENIRKMIVAMGKDIRVVLVKLADRLHNMRTLNHMPYEKQAAIAQETLDIYAPLAHRLGISSWKCELEDLSLRYLKPDIYYNLAQRVAKKKKEREKYIDDVKKILAQAVSKMSGRIDIQGRPKHLFSIYKKMQAKNLDYEQVYDILAFRILTENVSQCYEALGIVHSLFKPIPGRFKDYIAMAKANNYQSLHTTIVGPEAERIEIQIRTHDMHLVAENGIAAHWKYKQGAADVSADTLKKFNWLKELVSWHQQTRDPNEFLENVKTDLFDHEIYVFTPKGDVRELPDHATPLDFAYAIHTDLGHKTTGAKVNGRIVPLKHALKNGDSVEIITSPHQKPSKDWLKFCITNRAQSKIRAFIRNEERSQSVELGRALLEKEFRKFGLNWKKFSEDPVEVEKLMKGTKNGDLNELLIQVGFGKITPHKVLEVVAPGSQPVEEKPEEESFLGKVFKAAAKKSGKARSLVMVDGMDDLLVRYARCCNPIPGDPIIGTISRGRGITIHQASCPKVFETDTDRRIDVSWSKADLKDTGIDRQRQTKVRVVAQDAQGLLRLISDCFTTNGININNADIRTNKDKKAICIFDVTVSNRSQVMKVIQDLQKIKGIIEVERLNH